MSSAHVTYSQRPDATPEAERAQGEDRALDATDKLCGFLVALSGAVSYVARRDDDIP